MITVEEVIETYIQYDGNQQGLWTDYGTVFSHYLQRFHKELAHCSLFESREHPNVLTIRHTFIPESREHMFSIYRTDENAQPIQPVLLPSTRKPSPKNFWICITRTWI